MISWISSQVFYFSNPYRECVFWPKCLRETSNHWTFKEKAKGQGSRVMCQTRKRQDIKKSSFVEKGTFIYGKILGGALCSDFVSQNSHSKFSLFPFSPRSHHIYHMSFSWHEETPYWLTTHDLMC